MYIVGVTLIIYEKSNSIEFEYEYHKYFDKVRGVSY